MESTIHLLMASDEKYSKHLGVTLISALKNTRKPEKFQISVLDGGITDYTKNCLRKLVEDYGANITFKCLKLENTHNFIVSGHISLAAYYRIMLPQVYDTSVDKIIYLDCDVIVNHDLEELYNIELNGNVIGAVPEISNYRMSDFGFPDKPYFNSGVLLINYKEWIGQQITDTVLDFIYKNPDKLVYWDQDALNACLVDKWLPIDIKWNYLRDYAVMNKNWKNNKKFIPYIVHYSNNTKPWHYVSRNPYDYLYYYYQSISPWKGTKPQGKSLKRVLSKNIKLFLRKVNLMDSM